MNFYHLKYFYDSARLKSFTKASQANHVTLPAISQAIKTLESHLDCPLFVHKKNYFEVTANGAALLIKCEKLFENLEDITNLKKTTSDDLSGTIRLIAPQSIYLNWPSLKISRLLKKYPLLDLKLFTGNSRKIHELFIQKEIDLAICPHDQLLENYHRQTLKKGHFQLIYFPQAPKDQFLVGDFGSEVDHLKKMYQKRLKKSLPVKLEVQSWELIAEFTKEKIGVGLLPDFHRLFNDPKAKILDLNIPQLEYEICFYTKQDPNLKMKKLFDELSAPL